jgi:23S rRNA pseudouridine1911/1915/1917 synthase
MIPAKQPDDIGDDMSDDMSDENDTLDTMLWDDDDIYDEADDFAFVVETSGERLDKLVQEALESVWEDVSRNQVQSLIKGGQVLVDGKSMKAGNKLKGGETIRITLPDDDDGEVALQPEAIDLDVVYEDDDIAVVNKPAGMVVHPGIAQETGTLVHALLARYPQLVDMQDDPLTEGRMGIVHRLDKDTSGLIVVALHLASLQHLMAQFQARTVEKIYTALVERRPKTSEGVIDAPIGRNPKQRKQMAVVRDGKKAKTTFTVIDDQFRDDRALLEVTLHTGRTHQIRVHLAFINSPIVGDRVYGFRKQRTSLKRQFLHASRLSFEHPATGQRLTFESELPIGLQNMLDKLREV